MSRTTLFAPNEFYHIYNRGVDRRKVFLDERDYRRFLLLLFISNDSTRVHLSNIQGQTDSEIYTLEQDEHLVDIGAYCLMPNHFHILIRENIPSGISLFMQKLSTGYTMYFNKKNKRSGALFQGRFKAEYIDNDAYMRYLYSYIHLNPVGIIESGWKERRIEDLERARAFLNEYPYSSYFDYQSRERPERAILNKDAFPEYFDEEDISRLIEEVEEWLRVAEENSHINIKVEP